MKNSKSKRKINKVKVLFLIYCMILVWIILFKFSFSIKEITQLDKIRKINLIPFYYDSNVNLFHFHVTEVIENLLIFVPFGIYLKMLNKDNKKIIWCGFIFSLVLEISQFILRVGATDITDLITNTSGTAIGVLGYVILEKIFKNKNKINNVLKILALVGTVLFCLLMLLLILSN